MTSCAKKGCMDKFALNWNDDAVEDDGSCIYSADKMVGNWNVSVTFSNDSSSNFTASITKLDNNHIMIYWGTYLRYKSIKVDITNKIMDDEGWASPYFSITMNSENDFEIYDFAGVNSGVPFFGDYHHTR